MLGLNIGRGVATVLSVHPTRFCAPRSCTLGWEKALSTVATLPSPKHFFLVHLGVPLGKHCNLGENVVSWFSMLLSVLVPVGEPTPRHNDVGRNMDRITVRPHVPP